MMYIKAVIISAAIISNSAMAEAGLRGDKHAENQAKKYADTVTDGTTDEATAEAMDASDEMHLALWVNRMLKASVLNNDGNFDEGDTKSTKMNKNTNTNDRDDDGDGCDGCGVADESARPTLIPSTSIALIPTSSPTDKETPPTTASQSGMPSMRPVTQPTSSPTSQPTLLPTAKPSAPPAIFDSTIEVVCKPDGVTVLTQEEATAKTIICDANKPSCREAITAVKESEQLQNFFGCAGDLGEGAARKLFNKYASDDMLAGQLVLVAATKPLLVTERPDAMKEACMTVGMAQPPLVATPCCQGPLGCTSVTGSASNSPPFMTIAITACTGDSACKDMGPNPLILDSSCTGTSACELMNENEINPFITGITFVGEMACTTPQSCEGVGRRSHGDVTIQTGACIGSDACNSAGRRVVQKAPSYRFRSHIDIGANACVGSNACKDAHSTVNHGTAGKLTGSLTIGTGGCTADGSCEKMGFSDRMKTDLLVPPGGCSSVEVCRGCMTKTECSPDEFYFISDVDEACPKGDSSSGGNPTGDKVEEYCIGKNTLPTDCPTFSPTPFPTPVTSRPTAAPTSTPTLPPASLTVGCLSTPGNDTSVFNLVDGDVLCDGSTGTCAEFVSMVDALTDEGKRKMVKSIFGCNGADPPRPVALEVAQERFDKIKNEESVTKTLLAFATEDKKLFTGSASVVTNACNDRCCSGNDACTIDSDDDDVITVSSGSCTRSDACISIRPNAIILDSCKGTYACHRLGGFSKGEPDAGVEVGFRVIGPRACLAEESCNLLGRNIYGNIRAEEGACDTAFACSSIASHGPQRSTTTTRIVASVFIGKNACQGDSACSRLHDGDKLVGDVIIEDGACSGANTCENLGNVDSATNDIIIRAGVCTTAATCSSCAQGPLCASDTETYVIDDATMDCPGPFQSACEEL